MPIDVMVKEATGLPDKYVDMVVSYTRERKNLPTRFAIKEG